MNVNLPAEWYELLDLNIMKLILNKALTKLDIKQLLPTLSISQISMSLQRINLSEDLTISLVAGVMYYSMVIK